MQELLDFIKKQIELGELIGVSALVGEVGDCKYVVDYWVHDTYTNDEMVQTPFKSGKQKTFIF
ncbi:hypothetical protein VPHD85_0014 [Vibrio phage D85]|nr:hypothetical protein PODOV033v1_p0002 [Vibrio phage 252E42.2]